MKRLALLLVILLAGPAAAQEGWRPPARVETAVRAAVAERWKVPPAAVRLAWSTTPAAPPLPAGPVTLSGSGASGYWTVRVGPTRILRVRAGTEVRGAVAARDLPRGHVVTGADMEVGARTEWGEPREGRAGGVAAGWVTRRVVSAGEPLVAPAVEPPLVIRSGDTVRVAVRRGQASIEVRGVAAAGGRVGDRVPVRVGTGWKVDATVRGAGVLDAGSEGQR